MFCGFLSNHIDIAPTYAGTLMALTNTAATLPGIIVPFFVSEITHGNVSWNLIYLHNKKKQTQNKNSYFYLSLFIANYWSMACNILCDNCFIHY